VRSSLEWVAVLEGWVLYHERYCPTYAQRDLSRPPVGPYEPCCRHVMQGSMFHLRVVPHSNSCCGVTDTIVITNAETKADVGILPCMQTKFLGPLLLEHLVGLQGVVERLFPPVQALLPFSLHLHLDVARVVQLKSTAAFAESVAGLRGLLEAPPHTYADPTFCRNIDEIRKLLL
jgi:hypothetical protein